jgi:TNF receptor-associated factor 4
MTDFEGRKKRGEQWYSPAFYSHVGGYKMCLGIDANGWGSGKGTHVSVAVYMMTGEFDSHLKWSFTGEITVGLVNQTESTTHDVILTKTVSLSDPTDKIYQRVTEGDKATTGRGKPEFISHSDLYKHEEGKEYLVNDTLIFRVTNVEVTSV